MRIGSVAWFVCAGIAWGQKGPSIEETRDHWAFRPIVETISPQVEGTRNPIDSFVRDKISTKNLRFSPEASKATLLRRLSFDLTGLPPTFDEVLEFERDDRPDAYERLVDKLLASPRFGERWGRHWLDVARYADTKGYLAGGASRRYPFAYVYRDWVIRAFNEGMRYDEFVSKQLAADLMVDSPKHPDLAALGFLTVGPRFRERRHLIIDDRIDVVARGLMGMTAGCGRCHDHFYDPIPQEDYYSLYGVFDLARQPEELPVIGEPDRSSADYKAFEKALQKMEKTVEGHLHSQWAAVRSEKGLQAYLQVVHDGYDLSNGRLDALAAKRKLFPKLAIRWRSYLQTKERANDRLFAPWRAFAKASSNEYAAVTKTLLETGSSLPGFLARRLKMGPPRTFGDVVAWYANEFSNSLRKVEAGAKGKGIQAHVSVPTFPVGFDVSGVEPFFDTKARNRTNSLRAKVSKHYAEHPGSPPRAMTLVDDANPRNPRIFKRGNPSELGREVPRRFLAALTPKADRKPYVQGSGR
ncbi:MAG: hypothetical protein CMI32_08780, partial [Opitutales bacterium]|nr:hypothetical protein [Opitutales bacterium]